ncbi:hypothetical protein LJC09_00385 [Desulfovibrio sp. OttesenSCG-928-F20]|nr:hypothetical protein [Desulfovibrio sp. OttesenSCG-928-F20]
MTSELKQAVTRIAEVIMFENWLRFYFIAEEEGGTLRLLLPEKAMLQIKERYADFHDLALHLNGHEIDAQTSMKEICLFVSGDFNGRPLPEYVLAQVFDNPDFQAEMQLFSYWVQVHEQQLDAAFMEFSVWREQYEQWKKSDSVKSYAKDLAVKFTLASTDAPETSQ